MTELMFSNMLETIERLVPIGALCFVIWIAFKFYAQSKRVTEKQIELFSSVADKFSLAEEFIGFLQSKEGQVVLHNTASLKRSEYRSQLLFIQVGIMLTVIGIVFLLISYQKSGMLLLGLSAGFFMISYVTGLWKRKTKDERDN